MIALVKKELRQFFSSLTGYMVIGIFLVLSGLFCWVFDGNFNIIDSGFADMDGFFSVAPWILMFLIPAITMRSFTDEKTQGTIETLLTAPLSYSSLIYGKYVAALILVIISILPTFIYVYILSVTKSDTSALETGVITGSYLALYLLAMSYTAIGILASVISKNAIVSFLLAVLLTLLFFYGFTAMETTIPLLSEFSLEKHYTSISKGLITLKDTIYFLSFSLITILASLLILKSNRA